MFYSFTVNHEHRRIEVFDITNNVPIVLAHYLVLRFFNESILSDFRTYAVPIAIGIRTTLTQTALLSPPVYFPAAIPYLPRCERLYRYPLPKLSRTTRCSR